MQILQGKSEQILKTLPDNSVDSIVTDPPYELGFMGKAWDNTGIAYNVALWKECLRVLKPGGHLLAFGGSRTYHRMAVAIEDAGFEIRDMIEWVYGSGFPKSLNVGKAVDKIAGRIGESTIGIKREIRSRYEARGMTLKQFNDACGFEASGYLRESSTWASVLPTPEKWEKIKTVIQCNNEIDSLFEKAEREIVGYQARGNAVNTDFMSGGNNITKGTSEWEGWGTALKPAHEPICMARKPLSEKTVAENCLKWGTGGINIDGSRVEGEKGNGVWGSSNKTCKPTFCDSDTLHEFKSEQHPQGRFPANFIHDGSDEVLALFPNNAGAAAPVSSGKSGKSNGIYSDFANKGDDGRTFHNDSGSAARFFYCAKASKSERNEGCSNLESKNFGFSGGANGQLNKGNDVYLQDNIGLNRITQMKNNHPTVKPVSLMRYLVKLVTPAGGTTLDPFGGSGTTLVAAIQEGFNCIIIEEQSEYIEIIKARAAHDVKINAAQQKLEFTF